MTAEDYPVTAPTKLWRQPEAPVTHFRKRGGCYHLNWYIDHLDFTSSCKLSFSGQWRYCLTVALTAPPIPAPFLRLQMSSHFSSYIKIRCKSFTYLAVLGLQVRGLHTRLYPVARLYKAVNSQNRFQSNFLLLLYLNELVLMWWQYRVLISY